MATKTHFKLGLLTLGMIAALVVAALVLGFRPRPRQTFYTYFDESVHGLEVGAQVKYRGVLMGKVAAIELASDHTHVQVELAIHRDRLDGIDLVAIGPRLRTQLVMVGITGLKIVEIDVVDPATARSPALPFEPNQPYIASRPSFLKRFEERLASSGDRVPLLLDRMVATFEQLEGVIGEVRRGGFPQQLTVLADTTTAAISDLQRFVRQLGRAEVPHKLGSATEGLDRAAVQLNRILSKIDGQHGLVAGAERAVESVDNLGRTTRESTHELEQTLRDLGDAARAVRSFMEQLERQPDMLIKGRTTRTQ